MTATHYLIMKNRTAVGVVASDEADALRQAVDMGIRDGVVRVDAVLTEAEWNQAKGKGLIVPTDSLAEVVYRAVRKGRIF